MKGIEGLALKYILIIVVAAIIIGAAFGIIATFTDTAKSSAKSLNQTLAGGMNRTNVQACTSLGCSWDNVAKECNCTIGKPVV